MTIFPRYVSGRFKNLKVGISSYSEDRTALEVIGNVGVGTTNPDVAVGAGNTAKLAVGIATVYNIFADRYHGDENNNFYAGPFVGSGAAGITSGATLNIGIGQSSGYNLTTGKCNILIGHCVGIAHSTTCGSILIGSCAGKDVHGSESILIGNRAGCDLKFAGGNIGIGRQTYEGKIGGGGNIAIGAEAGREDNPTVTNLNSANISIGPWAGRTLAAGRCNVNIGYKAGEYNNSATGVCSNSDNVYIGTRAGSSVGYFNYTGCDISCNVMIGNRAGESMNYGPSNKANQNVLIGHCAFNQGRGACNIFIGPFSGFGRTGFHHCSRTHPQLYGDRNIGIGHSLTMPDTCGSNRLAIGQTSQYWITGDQYFNVGIGITDPSTAVIRADKTQKLAAGIVTSYNLFGEGAVLAGLSTVGGGNISKRGMHFPSMSCAIFGGSVGSGFDSSSGLSILNNNNFSYITHSAGSGGAGALLLISDKTNLMNRQFSKSFANFCNNSSVELFFDGTKRFATSGIGATIYGQLDTTDLNVTGVSTFTGLIDGNGGANIVGGSTLDQVNVTGVSTFAGAIDANGDLDVDGNTTLDNLVVAEAANIVGGLTADQLNVTGVTTFSGNVSIAGTLTYEDVTNVDSIGIVTAGHGLRVTKGGINVTAGISTFSDNTIIEGSLTVGNASGVTGGAPTDQGNLAVYGSGKNSLIIQTTSNTSDRGIAWRNSGDAYVAYISAVDRGNSYADLRFGVHDQNNSNVDLVSERMRITKEGSLGIGLINPAAKLDVLGQTKTTDLNVTGVSTFVGNAQFDGNVGIGSAIPQAKLEVRTQGNTQGGIFITDSNDSQAAPYLRVLGKRRDNNTGQNFSGRVLLASLRTDGDTASIGINTGRRIGTIMFGGNHTDASESNILYPASIAGVANSHFSSASSMPTDLVFYTGSIGRTATASNVSSGEERLRIASDGTISMGGNLNVSGVSTFVGVVTTSNDLFVGGNLSLKDSKFLRLGNNGDFSIIHRPDLDNSTFITQKEISAGTQLITFSPSITLQHNDGQKYFKADSSTGIYHPLVGTSGKIVLETNGIGVTVYNQLDTTDLNVTGVSTFSDDIFVGTGATVGFGSTAYFNHNVEVASDKTLRIGGNLSTRYFSAIDAVFTTNTSSQYITSSDSITLQSIAGGKYFKAGQYQTGIYHGAVGAGLRRIETNGVGVTVYNQLDTTHFNVSGVSTFKDDVEFHGVSGVSSVRFDKSDNSLKFVAGAKLKLGSNLEIFQDANGTSRIHATDGSERLQIRATDFRIAGSNGLKTSLRADVGDSVRLYFDNNLKFNTNSGGAKVTGNLNVTGVTTTGTLSVTGVSTFNDDVDFVGDPVGIAQTSIQFHKGSGTNTDLDALRFYDSAVASFGVGHTGGFVMRGNYNGAGPTHNSFILARGDNFFIDGGTGTSIVTRTEFGRKAIVANSDNGGSGTVELYHSSGGTATKRLETSGVGVTIYNQLDTTNFNVSGVSTFAGITTTSSTLFANQLNVAGVSTFNDNVFVADDKFLSVGDMQLSYISGSDAAFIVTPSSGSNQLILQSPGITLQDSNGNKYFKAASTNTRLFHNGSERLRTTSDGIQVSNGPIAGTSNAYLGTMTSLNVDTTFLNVSGVSTFTGNIDANGDLDVDGDTQLDDLNVAGVSTFSSLVDVNNRLDVVGGANIDQLNVAGVSTFAGIATFTGSNLFARGFSIAGVGTIVRASGALLGIESKNDSLTRLRIKNSARTYSLEVGNDSVFQIRDGTVGLERLKILPLGTVVVQNSLRVNKDLRITGVSTFTGDSIFLSNVGIGTTNPIAKLDVNVGTSVTAFNVVGNQGQLFEVTNNLTSGSIFEVNDVSGMPSIDVNADGTIQLAPHGTGELVGIGTTSPTSKLHVVGDTLITGVSTFSGINNISGEVNIGDSATGQTTNRLRIGDDADIQIYHDSSTTNNHFIAQNGLFYLQNDNLRITAANTAKPFIRADVDSHVKLYYASNEKFATSGIGATVFGQLDTTDLNVAGVSTFGGDVSIAEKIVHTGDTNTNISFPDDDTILFKTNNYERLRIHKSDYLVSVGSTGDIANPTNSRFRIGGRRINQAGAFATLEFMNGLFSSSGDARATASIRASRDTDNYGVALTFHTAGSNPTGLSDGDFERLRIGRDGRVIIQTGNLYLPSQIIHKDDDDTLIEFQDNTINFDTGGTQRLRINSSGTAIFSGLVDANNRLDVVGGANIDQLNVTGVSTFAGITTFTSGNVFIANDLFVGGVEVTGGASIGEDITTRHFKATGISTFAGLVNIDAGGQANTFKVEDLTDNRIVIAGSGGELEDSANLTFDGSTLNVTGDATFSGNVSIAGTLTKEDVTNIDSVGLVTAGKGVRITSGGLNVASGISTFNANVDVKAELTANKLILDDDGSSSPTLTIAGDDENVFGMVLVNDTYKSSPAAGFKHTQLNSGEIQVLLRANNSATRLPYKIQQGNDSTGHWDSLTINADGAVSLAYGGNKKFETRTDGAAVVGILTANGLSVTSGVSTFTGDIDANGGANIVGGSTLDQLNVTGVSTHVGITTFQSRVFIGAATTAEARLNVGNDIEIFSSGQVARFRIPESSPHGILTFLDQPILQIGRSSIEYATFSSGQARFKIDNKLRLNVISDGIEVSGVTDTLGLNVTTGVSTFNGNIEAEGTLDVDGQTELDDLNVSGITTLSGNAEFKGSLTSFVGSGTGAGNGGAPFALWSKANNYLWFSDATRILMGFGQDLEIKHSGDESIIRDTRAGVGATLAIGADRLILRNKDGNEPYLEANDNGSVKIYHDFFPKLETTGLGVTVYGTTQTQQLNVSGVGTIGSGSSGQAILQYQGATKLETQSWGVRGQGTIQTIGGRLETAHTGSQTEGYSVKLLNLNGLGGIKDLLEIGHTSNNSFITGHVGNISINAPQVSISTNFTVAGVSTFSALVDVNNRLDVVGGANIDQLNVAGVSTFAGITTVTGSDLFAQRLNVAGISTFHSRIKAFGRIDVGDVGTTGQIRISNGTGYVFQVASIGGNLTLRSSNGGVKADDNIGRNLFFGSPGGAFSIYHSGNKKLNTTSTGVDVTGNVVSDGLVVDGHSELDNINVAGVSTFSDTVKIGTGVTALTNGNVSIGGTLELFNTTGNSSNNPSEIKLSTFSIGQHNNVGTMKIMNNNATGTLIIGAGGGGYGGILLYNKNLNARYLQAHNEGSVEIFHDNIVRFETSGIGATVYGQLDVTDINASGVVTATSFSGSGANLTGIGTQTNLGSFDNLVVAGVTTFKDDVEFHGVLGVSSITFDKSDNSLKFKDNARLRFGDDNRFQIYYKDNVNYIMAETAVDDIEIGTHGGDIILETVVGSQKGAEFKYGSSVDLYYKNIKRFATSGVGVTIYNQLDTTDLNVSGVSTFTGNIDANGTLDVDGQTSLDDVLVAGFTTFFPTGGTKFLTTIEAENGMFVHNSGVSTYKTPVQIDAGATLNQLNVSGVTTFNGGDVLFDGATGGRDVVWDHSADIMKWKDHAVAAFGNGSDFRIWHDGARTNMVEGGTGTLQISGSGSVKLDIIQSTYSTDYIARFINDRVELYAGATKRLETTSTGAVVTGILTATNFVGNLSGIATGATRVYIDESEDDSNFYNIPFLDSTDPGDRHHALQVDHASFQYNPAVNALLVDRITPRSGQALQLDNGGLERARVHTNGNFGINNTSPTSKLDVGGDAKISGVVTATDFDATSDIRLKTNVQPIEDPIAKVIQIEGVSFNWKKDNRPALGVIADQVEKVLPQLVHGDDPKTVNYNGLVGLLIEVVKDQQKQIDTLSERLSKLE